MSKKPPSVPSQEPQATADTMYPSEGNPLDAARDPTAADTIDGRYHLFEELGRGGMGVVFLAEDLRLHRQVAIKFLRAQATDRDLLRFRHEARLLASLSHPNVVKVFDLGEHRERPYFVMEFVAGRTLADVLDEAQGEGLPVDVAIGFGRQLCEALSAVHKQGIIHRDIKPGNVIVAGGTTAVLMDFGLARKTVSEADRGMVSGTPHYLAPEDIRGEPLEGDEARRSDIYALGVTLFELISGMLPFDGENTAQVLHKKLTEAAPSLCELRPDVPAAFDAVISRALEKDPRRRQASCSELVSELSAARSIAVEQPHAPRSRSGRLRIVPDAPDAPDAPVQARPKRVALILAGGPHRERLCEGARAALPGVEVALLPPAATGGAHAGEPRRPLRELLEASPPSLVVVDLDLLEESPMELCARLKSSPSTSVPVIALAEDLAPSEELLLGRMNVELLRKPVDAARLAAKITSLLSR